MRLVIDIPDDIVRKIITSTMENYPEASSTNAMQCHDFNYEKLRFHFQDADTGAKYRVNETMLRKAFKLIFTEKWPKGCVQPPASSRWEDWDQWLGECDNTSHDAFLQLAIFGQVVYG
jgi:hypothetical protein